MSSFVNPHDIALWGAITLRMGKWKLRAQLDGSKVPEDLFDSRYAATSREDLSRKPSCQNSYLETYSSMLQPTPNSRDYRRFYYQLQENVNREVQKVLDALHEHPAMARDTIVIFTSDHGDMLGAHGGMHQKWHQAYEESTHVPFIFHNPTMFSGRQAIDTLTSHADVIPTMIGRPAWTLTACGGGWLRPTTRHTRLWDATSRDCCWVMASRPRSTTPCIS